MTDVAALRSRIEKLSRQREGTIDPIGLAHASRLLASAETRPEAARERILARAEHALAAVHARVEEAQKRAANRIELLSLSGFEVEGLREKLVHGGSLHIERVFRRATVLKREPRRRDPAIEARLASLARSAGVTLQGSRGESLFELADTLYRKAASETSASLVLDRVTRGKPSDAGRYHAATVSAAILVAMRDASPGYLAAHLARLELAGNITRLLRAFEPLEEETPKSRSRAKSGGKAPAKSSTPRAPRSSKAERKPSAKKTAPPETPAAEAPAPSDTEAAKAPARKGRGKKR